MVLLDHGVRGRAVYRRQLPVPTVSGGLVWRLCSAVLVVVFGPMLARCGAFELLVLMDSARGLFTQAALSPSASFVLESVFICAGFYCLSGSSSATQIPCSGGYYCGAGSSTATQYPCATGAFCPLASAAATICTAGNFCNTTGLSAVSGACSVGFFCPPGSNSSFSHPCPPGTIGNTTLLTRVEDCATCPPRFACAAGTNPDTQPPVACAAGYFCPAGSSSAQQVACAAGTYSASTNASAAFDCQTCEVSGSYCPAASTAPLLCAAGSFSNATGAATCQTTPAGSFNDLSGANASAACPAGTFSAAGASACGACAAGSFCLGGTSQSVMQSAAAQCAAGLYCPAGTSVAPSLPAFACAPSGGMFCLAGVTAPANCTPGSYQPSINASACLSCAPGSYCAATRLTTASGFCNAGFYCPPGSLNATGAGACPPGWYCPSGGIDRAPCAAGIFCAVPGETMPFGSRFQPNLFTRFYAASWSDSITDVNGPPGPGWAPVIGSSGLFAPIAWQGDDARVSYTWSFKSISEGFVYSASNHSTIQFKVSANGGVAMYLGGQPVLVHWQCCLAAGTLSPVVALGAGFTKLTVRYLNSGHGGSLLNVAFRMGGSENFTMDGAGVFFSSLQQWCVTESPIT